MTKKQVFNEIKGYLFMLLGCIAYGGSTSLFLAPPSLDKELWIVAGGVSGLAVIFSNMFTFLETGGWIILLNIPILIAGLRMGLEIYYSRPDYHYHAWYRNRPYRYDTLCL